jgi:hypothetical protein
MTSKNKDNLLKQTFVTRTHGYLDVSLKRDLFIELSKSFNGEFAMKHTSDNVLETFNISIPYKNRIIDMSESDTRPLKFLVLSDSLQDFELLITWKDTFDKMLKRFRKPPIEVGMKDFDDHYLIKSNRSDLTKKIISEQIQNYLLKYNVYSISIETDRKLNKTSLISVISRTLDDKKSYEDMIMLHQLLIDNLDKQMIIK